MSNTYSLTELKGKILPLQTQARVRNQWLGQRLNEIIPALMLRENVDLWLIITQEYNEDPVIMTFLPEPYMSARRRTILLFCRNSDGSVDRLSVSRYSLGEWYTHAWNADQESQLDCLARIVRERDPQRIAINTSKTFAFGDGLSHSDFELLSDVLGSTYQQRFCSAERLCVGWLEWRIEPELIVYPGLVEMGHALIAEAFSRQVIQPGITTTEDVVWWFRQTMHDLGLKAWFHPTVEIQAIDQPQDTLNTGERRKLILPGDVLHCDVGFFYLGLATDQQQHAYVLCQDETDAPESLKAALRAGNRLQDIHMAAMQVGRTGNEVLKNTLEQAKNEGIQPQVYSHPLGYHGHAAGPVFGLWDMQTGVPGKGDYEIFDNTCYSIELNIRKAVQQWEGREVRIALEEDAILSGNTIRWIHGRQTEFHLI